MSVKKPQPQKTFLSYVLSSHQDALLNYLVPSLTSFLLYVLLFASDSAVVFRHYKDDNPIWASLTIFVVYLPSLFSYIVIISSWELWPEMEGCEQKNCVWFVVKTLEHLLFPVWAMWRFAERTFWSIEALRATDNEDVSHAVTTVTAPRTIELYFFFQAFLHSLPQMLLQLNILMRQDYKVHKQTADAEVLSFVFNLMKVAATIAFYQRFKTQKLAGKQYPWFKSYKKPQGCAIDQLDSAPKNTTLSENMSLHEEPQVSESRRSSDFYLEPEIREVPITVRETSVIDGPQRRVYQEISEPDFNIRRVEIVKGLPEDDLAGKLVSFLWWSCFLVARILAISAFFYFHPTATVWLLCSHVVIVILFLLYDVKSDDVRRGKAIFFLFIGLIYIFCIIEFKINFKKSKFMYIAYFALVFSENFVMCLVWWFRNVDELQNDFWFRYILIIVVMGSIASVTSMMLYLIIYKPKKIAVNEKIVQ